MKPENERRLIVLLVWISRILLGGIFIISGWAKAIDPWGFLLKVNDYLAVWDFSLPRELVLTACVVLSCLEFATGVFILFGALKRVAVWSAALMLLFFTPLTLYVAIADPVPECGCFGDFIVLSNTATFIKNLILCIPVVFLLICNRSVKGIYHPAVQWLVGVVSLLFPFVLSFMGYQIQPLVDFRPYPVGSVLFESPQGDEDEESFIYEKDGVRQTFTLDNLPDSTWTFVEMPENEPDLSFASGLTVRDESHDDVTDKLVDTSDGAPQIFLIVSNPGVQFLSKSHFVSELSDFAEENGISMVGIIAANGQRLRTWKEWMRPQFPVYTSSDTELKQLVRGDAALVYTEGGIIKWKRTLASSDFSLSDTESLRAEEPVDDGRLHGILLLVYLSALLLIYILNLSPRIIHGLFSK